MREANVVRGFVGGVAWEYAGRRGSEEVTVRPQTIHESDVPVLVIPDTGDPYLALEKAEAWFHADSHDTRETFDVVHHLRNTVLILQAIVDGREASSQKEAPRGLREGDGEK